MRTLAASEHAPEPRWGNIIVLPGTLLVNSAAFHSWAYLLPLYLRRLGATDTEVGLTYTATALGFSLLQFYGGRLGDRYGRKPFVAWPSFFGALAFVMMARAEHWLVVLAALLVSNGASAFQFPNFMAMTGESGGRRGMAYAMTGIAWTLGAVVGPGAGSLLVPVVGLRGLLLAGGVLSVVIGVVRVVYLQETRQPSPEIADAPARIDPGMWRAIGVLSLGSILGAMTFTGPFIPLYLRDVLGRSEVAINRMFFVSALVAAVTSYFAGRAVDRRGSRAMIMAGVLAHAGLLLAWVRVADHPAGLTLFAFSHTAFLVAIISRDTFLADLTTQATRGTVIGLVGTIGGVVGSVGPAAGAVVRAAWGPPAPFWVAAGLAVVIAAGLTTLRGAGPRAGDPA